MTVNNVNTINTTNTTVHKSNNNSNRGRRHMNNQVQNMREKIDSFSSKLIMLELAEKRRDKEIEKINSDVTEITNSITKFNNIVNEINNNVIFDIKSLQDDIKICKIDSHAIKMAMVTVQNDVNTKAINDEKYKPADEVYVKKEIEQMAHKILINIANASVFGAAVVSAVVFYIINVP